MATEPAGDDWWEAAGPGIFVRSRKSGQEERVARLEESRLQEVMDRAAVTFLDPTRPVTRPLELAPSTSPSTFRPERSRRR
jgi:hypothetical protein